MDFNFDSAFKDLLKAEEAAGRPVPDEIRGHIRDNRVCWRSALLIAQDMVVAMGQGPGAVTLSFVIDVLDRFPPWAGEDHTD